MRRPERPANDDGGTPEPADTGAVRWQAVMWAAAVGGFALAMWLSQRGAQATRGQDLRTPGVLALDAALAASLALGFGARRGALAGPVGAVWSVVYGLWSAAAFRLSPLQQGVLFSSNLTSPDVPFIVVGAGVQGFIAFLFALPYARRELSPQGRLPPDRDAEVWELAAAGVLVFFVIAALVRVRVEL